MTQGKACRNCGETLHGDFCSACGQKDIDLERPFWDLAVDYLDAVFAADGRVWRTLWCMIAVPGAVARGHLDGRRASFVTPVKFYLFISVAFFLILAASNVLLIRFLPHLTTLQSGDRLPIAVSSETLTEPEQVVSFEITFFVPLDSASPVPELPQEVKAEIAAETSPGMQSFFAGVDALALDPARTNGLLQDWVPLLLVIIMPLFALWLKALHPRAQLYGHLVFSLYFHAFLFLVLCILVPSAGLAKAHVPGAVWGGIFAAGFVAHLFAALHRVYDLGWLRTVFTFIAAVAGYAVIFGTSLAAMMLYILA